MVKVVSQPKRKAPPEHLARASSMTDFKQSIPKALSSSVYMAASLLLLTVAMLILVVFVSYKRVQPIAIDASGRVLPLVPLDRPYVNDSRVLGFVDECLRRSFSHDYENYRLTINDAKKCYTPGGAKEFEDAIRPLINDMTRFNLVMSVSLETSVVSKRYIRDGIYVWETETPLTLYRRGTRDTLSPSRFLVTSLVIRVPLEHDVRGISIRAIDLSPFKPGSR